MSNPITVKHDSFDNITIKRLSGMQSYSFYIPELKEFVEWAATSYPKLSFVCESYGSVIQTFHIYDEFLKVGDIGTSRSWKTGKTSLTMSNSKIKASLERGDCKRTTSLKSAKKTFEKYFGDLTTDSHKLSTLFTHVLSEIQSSRGQLNGAHYRIVSQFSEQYFDFIRKDGGDLQVFVNTLSDQDSARFVKLLRDLEEAEAESARVSTALGTGCMVRELPDGVHLMQRVTNLSGSYNVEPVYSEPTRCEYDDIPEDIAGKLGMLKIMRHQSKQEKEKTPYELGMHIDDNTFYVSLGE